MSGGLAWSTARCWPSCAVIGPSSWIAVEHLPVGFGAHHWRASLRGEPRLFVTLDAVSARHCAVSLEAAYTVAAALGVDFVVVSLPTCTGEYTVALEHRRLSCAPWIAGEVAGCRPVADDDLRGLAAALRSSWRPALTTSLPALRRPGEQPRKTVS